MGSSGHLGSRRRRLLGGVIHAPDPPGDGVDGYIHHPDVEQSCEYLAAKLIEAPCWVGISGPPGVGKTLVARRLLRRLSGMFTVAHVPTSDLPPEQVERWILSQLCATDDSSLALARRLAARGRPLLAALDEAHLASPALLEWQRSWCKEGNGRAVLIWTELDGDPSLPSRLGCAARIFIEPLALRDVPAFVTAKLTQANASDPVRVGFAGHTIDRIALVSGGNQRRIGQLVDVELVARSRRGRPRNLTLRADPLARNVRSGTNARRGAKRSPIARLLRWLSVVGTRLVRAFAP
jgi:hypothetical protein